MIQSEDGSESYYHTTGVCVCVCVSFCAEDVSNLETTVSRVEMIRKEEIGGLELSA